MCLHASASEEIDNGECCNVIKDQEWSRMIPKTTAAEERARERERERERERMQQFLITALDNDLIPVARVLRSRAAWLYRKEAKPERREEEKVWK